MVPKATWFCVDIECSGPVPALYDMLSLGITVVKRSGEGWTIGDSWYVEIAPTAPHVDPGAMKVNGLNLERLKAEGRSLDEALEGVSAFVAEHLEGGTTPVFVGHNAPFDWSFVNYAYVASGKTNPFGYKALDTKAYASGVLGMHWLDSNKEELAVQLDLPEVEDEKVHRADYDAWYQAHILVGLLEHTRRSA
jgi:DNA polymerase III alpha subunit (gram-positive type)